MYIIKLAKRFREHWAQSYVSKIYDDVPIEKNP